MIFEFKGNKPVIDPSSFIHPQANVTGDVIIGKNVYIGPGASIRGDWGQVNISDGCNIQDNCTIHIFPGKNVILKENAHIGHGAIIHGATIGRNTLIGMNAVILDDTVVGDECIIGALTFLKGESRIEDRKIVIGNPGKVTGDVTEKMIKWKSKGTKLYHNLPKECMTNMQECQPLEKIEQNRKTQKITFETWKKSNK